jgi:hypothetical protein
MAENRGVQSAVKERPEGKKHHGTPRHRCEFNINTGLASEERKGMECIFQTQNWDRLIPP